MGGVARSYDVTATNQKLCTFRVKTHMQRTREVPDSRADYQIGVNGTVEVSNDLVDAGWSSFGAIDRWREGREGLRPKDWRTKDMSDKKRGRGQRSKDAKKQRSEEAKSRCEDCWQGPILWFSLLVRRGEEHRLWTNELQAL